MRASKVCSEPSCANLQPCPDHKPKPWAGSTRRQHTKSGWTQQREARGIMSRYKGVCHVCHEPGADEVDHVIPLSRGGADTSANKRPIHREPCHREKTQAEAAKFVS